MTTSADLDRTIAYARSAFRCMPPGAQADLERLHAALRDAAHRLEVDVDDDAVQQGVVFAAIVMRAALSVDTDPWAIVGAIVSFVAERGET